MANGMTAVLFAAGHLVNHPTLWAVAVILPALVSGSFGAGTAASGQQLRCTCFATPGILW